MKLCEPKNLDNAADLPQEIAATASAIDRIKRSTELFGSRRELLIEHAGCVYRLRITQHNKLILTK